MKNLSSQKKEELLTFVLMIVFVLLFSFVYSLYFKKIKTASSEITVEDIAREQRETFLKQGENQKNIDKQLSFELKSVSNTFEKPFVSVNPYSISPLTAVVIFKTATPQKISGVVGGREERVDINFTLSEYTTEHLVPIYGLYAGVENKIILIATDKDNKIEKTFLEIQTENLPEKLKVINIGILRKDIKNIQQGFNFLFEYSPKFAFDSEGKIRWFLDIPTILSTLYNYNEGHIIVSVGRKGAGQVLICEMNLLGKIYSINSANYGAHHDIEKIKEEDLLITGFEGQDTIEDITYELNPNTGIIKNVLDFKNILDQKQPGLDDTAYNWMHMNSAIESKEDGSIIISARNQSAIIKLSYPEGEIKWILASHNQWGPKYLGYLLTPLEKSLNGQ